MKDWPFVLFIVGIIIISVSGLALGRKVLPALTAIGYIVGFVLGYIFQFDYGPGLNSLWEIWTCVYLMAISFGIIVGFCRKQETN